jgi:peptidoglycan/xylan/chitin deacetylase (PgdA/CDA1 family)
MNTKYKVLAQITPFFFVKHTIKKVLFLPFYHTVSDVEIAHIKYLYTVKRVEGFKNDLDFILKHYRPVSIDTFYEHVLDRTHLKSNSFLLTFDDGYRQIFDTVAPLLKSKGIPAIFFISTDFIDNKNLFYRCKASILVDKLRRCGVLHSIHQKNVVQLLKEHKAFYKDIERSIRRIPYTKKTLLDDIAQELGVSFETYLKEYKPYLTTAQIDKLMQDGFSIGAHSRDHPLFEHLALVDQVKQTTESLEILQQKFKIQRKLFAFPFNDHGVPPQYFDKTGKFVEIYFGTGGFHPPSPYNCLQRVPMEIPNLTTQNIVKYFYFQNRRKLKNTVQGDMK